MTTAPYDQAKFADHEGSNLDSYSTVKGCPFFELAIGTSWRTFCFSTYAGSKDQLVATRESQFSEPTMTYQTHSNSLFILPKATYVQIIAYQCRTYFMVLPSVHLWLPLKATNVNERPCRHGPISVPKGNCCSFGSCFWDIFLKQHSMIVCAHNLSLMLPGEQKHSHQPSFFSSSSLWKLTGIFGRRVAMSDSLNWSKWTASPWCTVSGAMDGRNWSWCGATSGKKAVKLDATWPKAWWSWLCCPARSETKLLTTDFKAMLQTRVLRSPTVASNGCLWIETK